MSTPIRFTTMRELRTAADMAGLSQEFEELERQSKNAAILAQQVADLTADLQREHEDHKQTNDDAATYMRECERLTAERDALRAKNERLRNACASGWGEPELVNALRADIEALRTDAERYRHLKAHHAREEGDYGDVALRFVCDFNHYNDIDGAIDAARGKP